MINIIHKFPPQKEKKKKLITIGSPKKEKEKRSSSIEYNDICKVTNYSPNPKEIGNGNGPNKPNTINL